MRGLRISIIFLSLLFFLLASTTVTQAEPQPQVSGFSAQNAYEHARYLSQKIGPRPAGSKGEEKAAQYIYYLLGQAGWKVKEQPFSKIVVQNNPLNPENRIQVISSQNIVAELPGQNSETVVLGAHYDSADLSAPGALDNASGVGVLLELARVLGSQPQKESYEFVFFGAEEAGLVGSEYFAAQNDLSAVRWMLNLDMVGSPLEIDIAGKTSTPPELVRQVVNSVKQAGLPYHLSRDFLVMTRDGTQGGNSDFSPFLDQGIPAIGLGIAGRPEGFYHRPEDQIEKVSLQNIEQVGQLVLQLLQSVKTTTLGPRTWDTSYLPFQLRSHVFILSALGLRLFFVAVFFLTGYLLIRIFRNKGKMEIRNALNYALGVLTLTLLALIIVLLSGGGEALWQRVKGMETLWFAHAGIFLLARLILGACLLVSSVWLLKRVPLSRSATFYWLGATGFLLFLSIFLGLYRLDLAFPFVFWLLVMDILHFWPRIILAIFAPYFIYRTHWELLNSQQWISFYETTHQYPVIFTLVYTVLLLPVLFSVLYVMFRKPQFYRRIFPLLRWPAAILFIGTVLGLGIIPAYTRDYPQHVHVQKEWAGGQTAQYHIQSQDVLPREIIKSLQIKPEEGLHLQNSGNSFYIPAPAEKPPMNLEGVLQDKGSRSFNLNMSMNYTREPYRVKISILSSKPFRLTQMDDFVPISKLPRKVKLEGKEKAGQYELILERTPPQKSTLQWSIAGEGKIHVSVEVTFPDFQPSLTFQKSNLSVDYSEIYRSEFNF